MKLVRYGNAGAEKPGMIDADGTLRDLSAHVDDIAGAALGDETLDRLRALDPASLPAVEGNPRLALPLKGLARRTADRRAEDRRVFRAVRERLAAGRELTPDNLGS